MSPDLTFDVNLDHYTSAFTGAPISYASKRQRTPAVSSNHAEILALHDASCECIWLRRTISDTLQGISTPPINSPTTIHEDNQACITQMEKGYVATENLKHIAPKFFHTHTLIKTKEITLSYIQSKQNTADIFTKSLGPAPHKICVERLGLITRDTLTARLQDDSRL